MASRELNLAKARREQLKAQLLLSHTRMQALDAEKQYIEAHREAIFQTLQDTNEEVVRLRRTLRLMQDKLYTDKGDCGWNEADTSSICELSDVVDEEEEAEAEEVSKH